MVPAYEAEAAHTITSRFVSHSREELSEALARVAVEGWDGPSATAFLELVKTDVVQPLVRTAGLCGAAARQAEATGWAMAWETLRRPSLLDAASPWGVLWVAVRRAVFGEKVAADNVSEPRTAWRLCGRRGRIEPVMTRTESLDRLAALGVEGRTPALRESAGSGILDDLAEAFVRAGWPEGLARRLVFQIAATAPHPSRRTEGGHGWRHLAVELGIQPWQARRATLLVLGSPEHPGLAERAVREGAHILREDDVQRALREIIRARRRRCSAA
jgi:hypothetical protein